MRARKQNSIQKKTWDNAKEHCEQIGGTLFSDVDGSKEQLDFFHQRIGWKSAWLGIYTVDRNSWLNTEGIPISDSRLHWAEIQPFNDGGNQGCSKFCTRFFYF